MLKPSHPAAPSSKAASLPMAGSGDSGRAAFKATTRLCSQPTPVCLALILFFCDTRLQRPIEECTREGPRAGLPTVWGAQGAFARVSWAVCFACPVFPNPRTLLASQANLCSGSALKQASRPSEILFKGVKKIPRDLKSKCPHVSLRIRRIT